MHVIQGVEITRGTKGVNRGRVVITFDGDCYNLIRTHKFFDMTGQLDRAIRNPN